MKQLRAWLVVCALVVAASTACTKSARPAPEEEPRPAPPEQSRQEAPSPSPDRATPQQPSPQGPLEHPEPSSTKEPSVSSATFKFIGRHRDRPPLSTLEFDVSLRNPGARARWFLLPTAVAKGQRPMDSSVFGASLFELSGSSGKALLARFAGAPGFYALHLPAGAEVELRGLQIRATGDLPGNPLPLEVITADALSVGGQPPESWLKQIPTVEARADVSQKGARRLVEYSTPDQKDVPVVLEGVERHTESVAVTD